MAKRRSGPRPAPRESAQRQQARVHALRIDRARGIIVDLFMLCMLGIFPLVVGGGRYANIPDIKTLFFWFATLILLASLLILRVCAIFLAKERPSLQEFFRRTTIADYALFVFLIAAALSTFFSKYAVQAFVGNLSRYDGLLTQALYVLLFLTLSRVYRLKEWHFVIAAISTMLVAFIGILQFWGVNPLRLGPEVLYFEHQFYTTIGNLDFVSTYTMMMTVLFAVLFVKKTSNVRYLYLSACVFAFALQWITDTATGWLCLPIMAALLVPYLFSDIPTAKRTLVLGLCLAAAAFLFTFSYKLAVDKASFLQGIRNMWGLILLGVAALYGLFYALGRRTSGHSYPKRVVWGSIAAVGMVGMVVVFLLMRNVQGSIFYEIHEILQGRFTDELGSSRGFAWNRSWALYLQNPILGSGPDTYGRVMAEIFGPDSGIFDKAHNEYIQYAVTQGIVGLVSYLTFLIGAVTCTLRTRAHQPVEMYALLAMAVIYAIQAFFNFSIPVVAPIFWVAIAAMMALARRHRAGGNADLHVVRGARA